MRPPFVLLVLLGASLIPLLGLLRDRPAADGFFLGGIQVNEPDHQRWLDALAAAGMNTVSVTDYARQADWDGAELTFSDDTSGVEGEIRAAKERGMKVVLILRVALDHAYPRNRFLWHGMIQPATEAGLDRWFERYGAFARRWAEIAERHGVDALMIGSELNALTSTVPVDELPVLEEYYLNPDKQERRRRELLEEAGRLEQEDFWLRDRRDGETFTSHLEARIAAEREWARRVAATDPEQVAAPAAEALARINHRRRRLEEKWTALIGELRRVYGGRLGYAANFDQYQAVSFWDRLDLMGINAYFPLRRRLSRAANPVALYPELVDGWRRVLGEIDELRRRRGLTGLPVMFTEMGYTYRANSTLEPWADTGFSLVGAPPVAGEPAVEEGGEVPRELVFWQQQPVDPRERALAVRALYQAHRELPRPFLTGILWWKLSTEPAHREVEAFVLLLDRRFPDPLLGELRRFVAPSPT